MVRLGVVPQSGRGRQQEGEEVQGEAAKRQPAAHCSGQGLLQREPAGGRVPADVPGRVGAAGGGREVAGGGPGRKAAGHEERLVHRGVHGRPGGNGRRMQIDRNLIVKADD
eukprot:scaffold39787_cov46-Prasinocladus_malaysianus.AAC.1